MTVAIEKILAAAKRIDKPYLNDLVDRYEAAKILARGPVKKRADYWKTELLVAEKRLREEFAQHRRK